MTQLATDRDTERREGKELGYDVAASAKIFGGALVCANASGYAAPGADTASFVFLGVSTDRVDNSSGANGDKKVTVKRDGVHLFNAAGMSLTDVGSDAYIVDDQTVGLAATTTNDIKCGKIVGFISATQVLVDIAK